MPHAAVFVSVGVSGAGMSVVHDFVYVGAWVRLGKFLHTDVQRFTMWRIPINCCISVGLLSQMRPMISG